MAIFKNIFNIGFSVANNIPSLLSRNNFLNYQRCATISSRSVEKKLGLPPRPKRAMSPYFLFASSVRSSLLAKNPGTSLMELTKMITDHWRSLDECEKEPFRQESKKQMSEYTKAVMEYEGSLTDEQREMIKAERARLNNIKQKNKMKLKLKELGRPKKPATPFVIYMLSRLNSKPKDVHFPTWLSTLAKEWAELPDTQKLQVQDEAKKLMQQYKADVLMWETKMIKMGHLDVVRSRVLLGLKGRIENENAKKTEEQMSPATETAPSTA